MKRHAPDPALFVALALVILTLLAIIAAFAGRSCARSMKEVFALSGASSDGLGQYAKELEQKDYDVFVRQVEAIDLGVGVHVGMAKGDLLEALGDADRSDRPSEAGETLHYYFPPNAKSPRPQDRHRAPENGYGENARLSLKLKDDKVVELELELPFVYQNTDRWDYFTLTDKPIAQCKAAEVKALLGTSAIETDTDATWEYYPAVKKVGSPPSASQPPAAAPAAKDDEAPPADAVVLAPKDYDAFAKSVKGFDFGIGVHLGQDWSGLVAALGEPWIDGAVVNGVRSCTFTLPPKELKPGQRYSSGSAMLTVALKDDVVREMHLLIPPFSKKSYYKYLQLNGKHLTECKAEDFERAFGEMSSGDPQFIMQWLYASEPVAGSPPRFTLIQAMCTGPGDGLDSLTITDINSSQLSTDGYGQSARYEGVGSARPKSDRSVYVHIGTDYSDDKTLRHLTIRLRDESAPKPAGGPQPAPRAKAPNGE